MPLTEQQKTRANTNTRLSTGLQKRSSTVNPNPTKAKNGIRGVSDATNTKKKISGRHKTSTPNSKNSSSETNNPVKGSSSQLNSSSAAAEFGLTRLLAAASAAVAVSPGVIRRGMEEAKNADIESTTCSQAEKSEQKGLNILLNIKNENLPETANKNGDTKHQSDEKYNTFARAIEMLPSFDDIEDDDEIEVPEILRDIPQNDEHLGPIQEGQSLPTFNKDRQFLQTPENRAKCKAIESKMLQNRRHYKKDSRFVLDLYTLTFDEDEDVDSIDTRGPVFENSIYVDRTSSDTIKLDLSKIQLKENSSYVTAKNNYHDFVSLEDYLVDYMSSKSGSVPGENSHSLQDIDLSLQPKTELAVQENENDNIGSLSGTR